MLKKLTKIGVTSMGRQQTLKQVRFLISKGPETYQANQQEKSEQHGKTPDWTNKLQLVEVSDWTIVPKYRVLNEDSSLGDSLDKTLDNERLLEMYEGMVRLQVYDHIMYECQRQGRISFYMTSTGEEAVMLGSAAALDHKDLIFSQYREVGVLLYRGMTFDQLIGQCLGNCDDLGKGRQMPVHYGSKELNFVTISSPLATQLPQAVGAAYGYKNMGDTDRVVVCYYGEGAASEGDAHAALNFASTLECPIIFLCRNNAYAISTPVHEQFRGDGVVSRAIGYGMDAIRVDGNDLIAVYNATKLARDIATQRQRPILIEAMTYRVGHHSTSDDSTAYRASHEIESWTRASVEPLGRMRNYIISLGMWSASREEELRQTTKKQVLEALGRAEKKLKGPISSMFHDVYHELPPNLSKQRDELNSHLEIYGEHYQLESYQKEEN